MAQNHRPRWQPPVSLELPLALAWAPSAASLPLSSRWPTACNLLPRRQYAEYTSDVAWFAKDTVGTFTNYANWQATSTWTDWTVNGGTPVASNIGVPWSWGGYSCASAFGFMCE